MSKQSDGIICTCLTFRCRKFSTRTRPGKLVRGRRVSACELRLHTEYDQILTIVGDKSGIISTEPDTDKMAMPSAHWRDANHLRRRSLSGAPLSTCRVNSGIHTDSLTYMSAVRADLTTRIANWRAQPSTSISSPPSGRPAPFPFAPDLEWLRRTFHEVQKIKGEGDADCTAAKDQLLHMIKTQTHDLEWRKECWECDLLVYSDVQVLHDAPIAPASSAGPTSAAILWLFAILGSMVYLCQRGLGVVLKLLKLDIDWTSPGGWTHGDQMSDDWRSTTVALPVVLGDMWDGKKSQTDEWFQWIAASQLATKRSTTKAQSKQYEWHVQRYLHGLRGSRYGSEDREAIETVRSTSTESLSGLMGWDIMQATP
ncbi:hypothetical protein AURDEDRAFT_128949 [Auricularia subglabra TFB-10046 SS5]|nr:hypothetical protein AURDEDRAFT_128949 [Auricularia subglabra TFB-10046 SS5]